MCLAVRVSRRFYCYCYCCYCCVMFIVVMRWRSGGVCDVVMRWRGGGGGVCDVVMRRVRVAAVRVAVMFATVVIVTVVIVERVPRPPFPLQNETQTCFRICSAITHNQRPHTRALARNEQKTIIFVCRLRVQREESRFFIRNHCSNCKRHKTLATRSSASKLA